MRFEKGKPKTEKKFEPWTSGKFKHRALAQKKHTKKPGLVTQEYDAKTKLTKGVDFMARGKKFDDGRRIGFEQLRKNEKSGFTLNYQIAWKLPDVLDYRWNLPNTIVLDR